MVNIKVRPYQTVTFGRKGIKKTFFLGFKKYFLILFLASFLLIFLAPIKVFAATAPVATAGNGQATIQFSIPTSTSAITGYVVNSSPGNISNTGSGSPITVSGLTNGQKYTFTVSATNSSGNGPNSAPSNQVKPLATITNATSAPAATTTPATSTDIKIQVPDTGPTNLQSIFDNIWNILFGFAGLVAVIFIIYGGYQYMTSGGGDGAEKAKKTILGAVIGLIIIIAAVAIVNFVNAVMHGNLHLFSTNLSNTQNSSGSGTTTGNNNSTSLTSPVATPLGTDISKIPNPNNDANVTAAINYCKNNEQKTINCYTSAATFLSGTTCGTDNVANLNDKAKEACQSLATFRDSLAYVTGSNKETINGASIDSTKDFSGCYSSYLLNNKIVQTCDAEITKLKNTINSGSTSPTTPATTTSTTTPTNTTNQQQLTPYQSCIKDSQTKYNSCQNQLAQACASQQSAYKACLSDAVYYIFRLFNSKYCDKVQQTYNTCQSNWQQNCSNAQSRAQQTCRLTYPTIY